MTAVTRSASMRGAVRVNAAVLVGVVGVALPVLSLLLPGSVRLHLLLFFSGAGVLTLGFRSGHVSEWLGLSIAASIVVASAVAGTLWALGVPDPRVLLAGIVAVNAAAAAVLLRRRREITLRAGAFDVAVLAVWLVLRLLQAAVLARNGFQPDAGGETAFVARGWFARDTLFFYALVEQAAEARAWPIWNPFFGNFGIVYPRLLHVGLAGLLTLSGQRIAEAAPGILGVGLLSIAAGSLGLVKSAARRAWHPVVLPLGAAVLFYALALRLDTLVYPQAQYFVLPVFLLFARVLLSLGRAPGPGDGWRFAAAAALGATLLLMHQVSGTAALVSWVAGGFWLGRVRRWPIAPWGGWAVVSAVLVLLFSLGGRDPALRWAASALDWETARAWLLSLRGWVPAILFALWAGVSYPGLRAPVWAGGALLLLTVSVVLWGAMQERGQAGFVLLFNAERYLYHAFLLASPGVAVLLSQAWRRCRGRTGLRVALVLLVTVPLFDLPSISYESRGLLGDEPLVVPPEGLRAYAWVREHTGADTVVLQAPAAGPSGRVRFDRTLPALTGRSLYLADVYNIWGQAGIPAYEHEGRVRFVREVFDGRPDARSLRDSCVARGIGLVLLSGPDSVRLGRSLAESRAFEAVFEEGGYLILRPAPSAPAGPAR